MMNKIFSLALLAVDTDIWPAHQQSTSLKAVLISFVVAMLVLALIGCLLYLIDRFIHTIPDEVRLVIAVVLAAAVIIWGVSLFL